MVIEAINVFEISQRGYAECNKNKTQGRPVKHQHLKGNQWSSNSWSPKRDQKMWATEAEKTMKGYAYVSQMQHSKEKMESIVQNATERHSHVGPEIYFHQI